MQSIKCVEENIDGGGIENSDGKIKFKKYKITYYENILNQIYEIINLSSIN